MIRDGKFLCDHWPSCGEIATNHLVSYGFNYCDNHLEPNKLMLETFHKGESEVARSSEGFSPV